MPSNKLTDLIDQYPSPDENGKLTSPDKGAMDEAVRQIHRGGPENVAAVVDMLAEPGKGDDLKPRHLLHAWATYVGGLEDSERRPFAQALAATLESDRPVEVKKFVTRQLQVAGGTEAVPLLARYLQDEPLCEPAAQALVAIGEEAAAAFREALPDARGRCRLTIIQALGVLGQGESAALLRDAVRDAEREELQDVRLTGLWALARVGDADSVDLLLEAADAQGFPRTKATNACLLLAENLAAGGKQEPARRIYRHLQETRTEPSEAHILAAASRGLDALD